MSKLVGLFLTILLFLLVLQVVILAPRDVNSPPPLPEDISRPMQKDVAQAMQGVHLLETTKGHREWELWSKQAVAFQQKAQWHLQGVKVIFFADNGVKFFVTGKEGSVETSNKNMRIQGDVVTRSSNGYIFRSQQVDYQAKARHLVSPGQVEMKGPRDAAGHHLHLTGDGLDVDMKDSLIRIHSHVRAERMVSKRHVVIHSNKAEFSGKGRLARFLQNVIIDMDGMRVTGPEATFQFDPAKNVVKSVHVTGNVKISDTEKWATAEDLKVLFNEDKYILRGHPRVVQDNDELRGDEIILMDGGRRVIVHRARAQVDDKSMGNMN